MTRFAAIAAALLAGPSASCAQDHAPLASTNPQTEANFRDRLPEDEVIYFVLPDRFANGDSLDEILYE